MTIGPDPRTRMEWMSVRLGIAAKHIEFTRRWGWHKSRKTCCRPLEDVCQTGGESMYMDKINVERLHLLLKRHEEMLEEKRSHPEDFLRQNEPFREAFSRSVRTMIVPVLEEIKDIMVGKVESASIFHRVTAAGLRIKLDRWEDFERSLLFFGDDAARVVRVTHDGIGFGLLSKRVPLAQLTPALIEEEAMKFLRRLFGEEQLRRPLQTAASLDGRRPAASALSRVGGSELLRI